jgi:DNA-binding CsgD family transcriptional regulator
MKTHLGLLFSKTGTNRRVDLVKTVAAHGNPLS